MLYHVSLPGHYPHGGRLNGLDYFRFLQRFKSCVPDQNTRNELRIYTHGLMSKLCLHGNDEETSLSGIVNTARILNAACHSADRRQRRLPQDLQFAGRAEGWLYSESLLNPTCLFGNTLPSIPVKQDGFSH